MGKISEEEKLEFTRRLREQRIEDEKQNGCEVDFQKGCMLALPEFLKKQKEKGIISTWSISENADSVSVNVPTHQKEALEHAWRTRFAQGGKREGAGRKKVGNVRKTWTIPDDIMEVKETKGIQYIWDAVRFKVAFDKMKGE